MSKVKSAREAKYKLTSKALFSVVPGKPRLRLSDLVTIKALAKVQGQDKFQAIIEFRNRQRKMTTLMLPLSILQKPSKLSEELADAGFALPHGDMGKAVLHYLSTMTVETIIHLSWKTGWLGPKAYAYEGKIIGDDAGRYIYRPAFEAYGRPVKPLRGSFENWQKGVAKPAEYSAVTMLAIAAAFAAPLLRTTKVESGGFHFFGKTSSGKTVSALAANSVHYPTSRGSITHWDITDTGLEQHTLKRNDGLMILDEINRLADDKKIAAKKAMNA